MKIIAAVALALSLTGCNLVAARELPRQETQYRYYNPQIVYSHGRYYYTCKYRGDVLVQRYNRVYCATRY